jgi:hypothetical protein
MAYYPHVSEQATSLPVGSLRIKLLPKMASSFKLLFELKQKAHQMRMGPVVRMQELIINWYIVR